MTADRAGDVAVAQFGARVATASVCGAWSTGAAPAPPGSAGSRADAGGRGGVLFVAALVLAAGGYTAALGAVHLMRGVPAGLRWAGLPLAAAGFARTPAGQSGMGTSWRIGVDETERTVLATTGLFGVVRNPIFTGMCAALMGSTMMVPTPITVAALVCLVVAVEVQVRVVEEPYVLMPHGSPYAGYGARVGRFLLGLGRLPRTAEVR